MTSNATKKALYSMLKENTGRSMLDSGGTPKYDKDGSYIGSEHGYGRSYERNQIRDFDKEQDIRLSLRWGYIEYTHNLYHFLCEHLELYNELDKEFDKFMALAPEEENWHSLADRFGHYLCALGHEVSGGVYPDESPMSCYPREGVLLREGINPHHKRKVAKLYAESPELFITKGRPLVENTYNSENNLSQDIEFRALYCDDYAVVVLQIHNGADARGGYTRPRVFSGEIDSLLVGYRDGYISCENGHQWSTDDAYNWYFEGSTRGRKLNEYPIVKAEDESYEEVMARVNEARELQAETEGQPVFEGMTPPNYSVNTGVIWVDENDIGHCPLCGGVL